MFRVSFTSCNFRFAVHSDIYGCHVLRDGGSIKMQSGPKVSNHL